MGSETFTDRVQSIVDGRWNEMLELFQDTEDRTSDLNDKLNRLISVLPLIQDIKTEIASIEKKIAPKPKEDDEEDDEEDKKPHEPPSDEDLFNLQRVIEDLSRKYIDNRTINQYLIDGPAGLPALIKPGKGKGVDFNWLRFATWLYSKIQDLKKAVQDGIADWITDKEVDAIRQSIWSTNKTVNEIRKILTDDITESLSDLGDKVDDLNENFGNCCQNVGEQLDQLSSDLNSCCQSTSEELSQIKRKVNELSPEADQNKDLALQTRARAILAEVQSLRGLL